MKARSGMGRLMGKANSEMATTFTRASLRMI